MHGKVFYIFKFDLNVPLLFFPMKAMVYRKKLYRKKFFFSVDYVKIIELHLVHT